MLRGDLKGGIEAGFIATGAGFKPRVIGYRSVEKILEQEDEVMRQLNPGSAK